jgi:uncharacterized protein
MSQRHRIETRLSDWGGGDAKSVTFIVTEACQLQCHYCYLTGKNTAHRMELPVAQRTIDYLLTDTKRFPERGLLLDFIGGEPLLEIELIEQICDHFKIQAYERGHRWFEHYMISITSNGLLYGDPRVQRFIRQNRTHLDITITIDGTQEKHDLQRRYPSGEGSYTDVVANLPLWLDQFPNANTKVTIAHDDLPHVCDSILHLWGLGIHDINANVVFEDVWHEGDDERFEEQLIRLADRILDEQLYLGHSCSFFDRSLGRPMDSDANWCGTGKMLAVDAGGDFYPCVRFAAFSLQNKRPVVIGNCRDGIDSNRLRPFLTLRRSAQSPRECLDCDVASGCAWCPGANYDFAETDTVFQRVTFICKMHKARVRANNYFWHRYDLVAGEA